MLFGYCFNIKTSLPKEEVIRIIKKVTIPFGIRSYFIKVSDYIFFVGKFENERFTCMPLPNKVPPYGRMNSFLPMIKGKMQGKKRTEIKIIVSGTWVYLIFLLCINTCLLLSFISEPLKWKAKLIIVGIDIFIAIYFRIVAVKVKVLFEELFGEKNK